jgi:hypothetical protein
MTSAQLIRIQKLLDQKNEEIRYLHKRNQHLFELINQSPKKKIFKTILFFISIRKLIRSFIFNIIFLYLFFYFQNHEIKCFLM